VAKDAEMLDNAAAKIRGVLEAIDTTRVLHPAHGPDIVRRILTSFGNLIEKWQSVAVTDRDSLIGQSFHGTQEDELSAVHQNRMKRLRRVIKKRGRCYKT
jgi:hypothetical protein